MGLGDAASHDGSVLPTQGSANPGLTIQALMDYNHWAAFGLLGEILPWADNRVTIADEKDQFGLPVARVTFNLHENDKKLIEFGKDKVIEVMSAAGAEEVVQEPRYAHLVGGARMGRDPDTSVVDCFGRTHDIPNLFICVKIVQRVPVKIVFDLENIRDFRSKIVPGLSTEPSIDVSNYDKKHPRSTQIPGTERQSERAQ